MKKKRLILILIPILILLSAQCQFESIGKLNENSINRSIAELKGEFADNHVLVVLKETDLYKEFSLEDFPQVMERCSKVEELTHGMTGLFRKQEEALMTGNWKELQYHIDHSMLMKKEAY